MILANSLVNIDAAKRFIFSRFYPSLVCFPNLNFGMFDYQSPILFNAGMVLFRKQLSLFAIIMRNVT